MRLDLVPHRQQFRHTCIPACLRMVLGYFGWERTEEELAALCGTRSVGTSVPGLLQALEALECEFRHLSGATREDLASFLAQECPIIVFLRMEAFGRGLVGRHAAVLCGLSSTAVELANPLSGTMETMPLDRFLPAWEAHASEGVVVLDVG